MRASHKEIAGSDVGHLIARACCYHRHVPDELELDTDRLRESISEPPSGSLLRNIALTTALLAALGAVAALHAGDTVNEALVLKIVPIAVIDPGHMLAILDGWIAPVSSSSDSNSSSSLRNKQ